MRGFGALLPLAVTVLAGAARSGQPAYDDRKVIAHCLKAAGELGRLVPSPRAAARGSGSFKKGRLADRLGDLRRTLREVTASLRAGGVPAEMMAHRRTMANGIRKVIARVDSYGRSAASLASARARLERLKKTQPNC